MASSIDVVEVLLSTTSTEEPLGLGFVVNDEPLVPIVDDVNRLERRRHRKKQRINRKRRERASRWMQTRRG